jgi:hypothetical protein
VTFPDKVSGYISMNGCTGLTSVTFPDKVSSSISMDGCMGLTSVTFPDKVNGYISMYGCTGLTSVTFPDKVNGFISMNERCSEELLAMDHKNIIYQISGVQFSKPLFDSVRKGILTVQEVFVLKNMEQRRVAYERMDKTKMAALKPVVVDEAADSMGGPLSIVSFDVDGFKEPFLYLRCICPSTGREYYLETRQKTCAAAIAVSFGLDKVTFEKEW